MPKFIVIFIMIALMSSVVHATPLLYTTTIDYLDYAFYDNIGSKEYYELECYERRIRELAEGGINQINLRTNCMGVALHPSKVLRRYGEDGRWHYSEPVASKRLIETLKRYDPVAETIRIGHKYGLQVWCWENICDEIGLGKTLEDEIPAECRELCRRRRGYPLADDFFLDHPECWARRKKATAEPTSKHHGPVAKIRLTSTVANRPAVNFGKEHLSIYFSDDNSIWRHYMSDFSFRSGQTSEGRNFIEFDGLEITSRFIKIAPVKTFDSYHIYTFVVKGQSYGEIFNAKGERLEGTWGCRVPGQGANLPENKMALAADYISHSSLDFENVPEMAFDYRLRQLGCCVGRYDEADLFVGMVEFCHPLALKHKLERFAELAAYPFDGYMLTMNCHISRSEPDSYSYNSAVRDRILKKTGKDIYRDDVPLQLLLDERQAGLSEYIEGCREVIGKRPLYLEGWGPGYGKGGMFQRENFGSIHPDYPRLIQKNIIDGVVMWHDFSEFLTPKMTGGRTIPMGLYIGLSGVKSMAETLKSFDKYSNLELVDFYESLLFASHPEWLKELKKRP